MKKDIAIYGAGGLGREILMLIQQINALRGETWSMIGFFDDGLAAGQLIHGYPVLGGIAELNGHPGPLAVVVAVGNPGVKRRLVAAIRSPVVFFPSLIHPSVALFDFQQVTVGAGCLVCAGTTLTVDIVLGCHVLLNLHCTVGHDSRIGDFCSLMPSVNVSGDVKLDEAVYVGTGASLINGVAVGRNAVVGAGAVVVRSLPADCTATGIPARPIKFHAVSA
ncbi:NeuD/PglB/VioB family sugar acetyltransferase [Tellurirhabdus rosea]|uniref:NeuD/PglB/VioB family sugar acetyltransferase n=1 Tax=Tellurirhabdus rosea TaxID=2674997 RepID=UPI00225A66FD|nr:NeuD/PglB/VioB family sugar acetyltransferase [Tellurirhabdus rosea]